MSVLKDIRVLDISRVLAGPNATQILADFGAEVWKIEALWGDEARTWGKSSFAMINRGKKSIAVNLAEPRGQDIIRALAKKADVAVENYKVDNLKRFGIDLKSLMTLNERLIAVSVTGFGQTGPNRDGLGYDMVLQAMTGLMSLTGDPDRPPARVGVAIYDIMLGLNAAIGILAALYERTSSGKGQHIDVSLFDVGMSSLLGVGTAYLNEGRVAMRQGSLHPTHVPVQPYQASDGLILVAVGTDEQFARLCSAIGRESFSTDPRFQTNAARMTNRVILEELLSEVLGTKTRQEWLDVFMAERVPAGPIYNVGEALEHPHSKARNVVWTFDDDGKPLHVLANPLQHMSRTPPKPTSGAPRLGADTLSVLMSQVGLTEEEINILARDNVIGVAQTEGVPAEASHGSGR
ncbi:CaiB/BaiF CoA transferase family protein [Microvirga pudoricolor]|uniref:CaiB/BaiF CoA transferase family protein n=1 Tax=Microvirga pudoricolor TaxID=2778729 RepID=UPI0019525165|nr:CoA transferase [Microvirga pudoricolor]MBM6593104.1 CoA transferase [Microvirga pudoricolor]